MGDAWISPRDSAHARTAAARAVPLGKWEYVAGLSPDGSLLALVSHECSARRSIRFLDVRANALACAHRRNSVLVGAGADGLTGERTVARTRRASRRTTRGCSWMPSAGAILRAAPHTRPPPRRVRRAERRQGWRCSSTRWATAPAGAGAVGRNPAVRRGEGSRRSRASSPGTVERSRRPAVIADPSVFARLRASAASTSPSPTIDLRTMTVRYHTLRGAPSPLARHAGLRSGTATWLGPGRIALGGWDDSRTATSCDSASRSWTRRRGA